MDKGARTKDMRTLVACLVCGLAVGHALGQSPEAGRIVHTGDVATLTVDSPCPLDSAAITLSEQLHIRVNVEDPLHSGLIPPGQPLEVSFRTNPDGQPNDVRALLETLRQAANSRYGFAYRLDNVDGTWTLVATTIDEVPLLDRRISIPGGMRMVLEHANLMAEELSRQTGVHVGCCQAGIAGVPWGMEKIWFGASDEPARRVLLRLIGATRGEYYWLLRCDPAVPFCFINLRGQR